MNNFKKRIRVSTPINGVNEKTKVDFNYAKVQEDLKKRAQETIDFCETLQKEGLENDK